jgi:tetratricopeptide (TPR) repeat protein
MKEHPMNTKTWQVILIFPLAVLTLMVALHLPASASNGEPSRDVRYWWEKGALCATYGNDEAAVRYFKEVVRLDPNRSDGHFQIGVSYGQLGEYAQALTAINRAVALNPDRALYYYGRGRVHLLAGDPDKAVIDFKHAATLGDPDARSYLAHTLKLAWE